MTFTDNQPLTAEELNDAFAGKQDSFGVEPAATVLGSVAGGPPGPLTAAQVTALLNAFTATLAGVVPAPPPNLTSWLSSAGWAQLPTPTPQRGYIAGLTLSAGGTQTVTVSPGQATSDDNTTSMVLASSLSKSLAGPWGVGLGNGALDTGFVAPSKWYHVFLIERTDTGVVDVLCSLSPNAPALPASYTKQRRLGSILTDASSNIVTFAQNGDEFIWAVSVLDLNGSTVTTAARSLYTLTVPPGFKVNALFRAQVNNTSIPGADVMFTSPDENDQVATAAADLGMVQVVGFWAAGRYSVRTSTSAQIGARSQQASTTINVLTFGWVDTRGRFD